MNIFFKFYQLIHYVCTIFYEYYDKIVANCALFPQKNFDSPIDIFV